MSSNQSVTGTLFKQEREDLLALLLKEQGMAIDAAQTITPRAQSGPAPLSYAQQRLWFLDQLTPGNAFYTMSEALHLKGPLVLTVLEQSLNEIMQRHDALRTTFAMDDKGQAVQIIHPALVITLPIINLEELPEIARESSAQRFATEAAQQPFDLAKGPLLRVTLLRLSAQHHVLLLTMHHIISDEWSMGVLIRELTTLYDARLAEHSSPLTALPVQYADFAYWQRQTLTETILATQLSYWKQQLKDLPILALPTDRPRSRIQSFRGAQERLTLPKALTENIKALSRKAGVTLFTTLLAAFKVLLYRYSHQTDIGIGFAIAGRNQVEVEGLIGFFVNSLILRSDLSGNPTFLDMLKGVSSVMLEAYNHQDVPFERLVEELQPERDLSRNPLFQVMFTLQNDPLSALQSSSLAVSLMEVEIPAVRFDLEVYLQESAEGLKAEFVYSTDLFEADTVASMMRHFQKLLESIVTEPSKRISNLELLAEAERHRLLVEWNAAPIEYPKQNLCIHQWFETQVERTPDAIAAIFENQHLTYRELNRQANQLAHYLQSLGVGPEVLVGVCLERSLQIVIGLLAILKAGGAYLPLDSLYPKDRLAFMLTDAKVSIVLTQQKLAMDLPTSDAQVVCLDTPLPALTTPHAAWNENPHSATTTDNIAYVIYTSGSTGKPKGVLVTHDNVIRLFQATEHWFGFDAQDVWTLFHSYAFDFSVWEIWGALLFGGRLVVVPYWVSRSPDDFHKLLRAEGVTVLNQTPSAFRQLILADEATPAEDLSLRWVIFGGEALDLQSLEPWFRRRGDRQPQLVNMYGITETTVHVTYRLLKEADLTTTAGSMIGVHIPDLQIYLLDNDYQPVPIGVSGELYVSGAGLARGYLNRPELTAERFIADPFNSQPGARLYKTGDLARYSTLGDIEYLGRIDQQVKIRGFRIELGEIEAEIKEHPGVLESIVMAGGDTEKRLIAYIIPDQNYKRAPVPELRSGKESLLKNHLRYELPNGMVIAHLNQAETDFLYQEIFVAETYLRHGIRLNENACIFDVGANIGLFTLFAGHKYKNAMIYAFEPIPPIMDVMRVNTLLYGLNVKLFECGLADEAKQVEFTYYPNVSIMSGRFADANEEGELVKSYLHHQHKDDANNTVLADEGLLDELLAERLKGEIFTCQLKTLSEVIRENGIECIDLLKIDVEKSELDVFNGIRAEDWRKIRQIVVEVHDTGGRLELMKALLEKQGYQLSIAQDALLKGTAIYDIYAVRQSAKSALGDVDGNDRPPPVTVNEETEQTLAAALLQPELVAQWQTVFDETYGQEDKGDPTFNIAGWNSSYTGQAIPAEEMREWVDHAVERIMALKPRRVLEIGCGTGLLLFRIAPHCAHYQATDFSAKAIDSLARQVTSSGLAGVTLSCREATDFKDFLPDSFDTVIINSVLQYFPSVDYLVRVLEEAVKVLTPQGSIFVGDVRNLALLEAFHASVELHRATPSLSTVQLRHRVQQQLTAEDELVIAPAFFSSLKRYLPKINHIEVLPKRARYDNELTRFRYDAILHAGPPTVPAPEIPWMEWQGLTVPAISQLLEKTQPDLLGIARVPNARVSDDVQIMELLAGDQNLATVSDVRQALQKRAQKGIDPEELWSITHDLRYAVEISWLSGDGEGRFDVLFRRRGGEAVNPPTWMPPLVSGEKVISPVRALHANQPLRKILFHNLVPELRAFLQQKLPDYMIPADFVLLDTLPMTPSGKLDRRALPVPGRVRAAQEKAYLAPRDSLETQLSKIWEKILGLESPGVQDNFFDLGGHSLLAVRLVTQIRKIFAKDIPLATLFQAPTIEQLANTLRQKEGPASWQSLVALQPSGTKPPLFLVPGAGGNLLHWRDLVPHLDPDQPFYALQPQGLGEGQHPFTSIEDMATYYLKEIRQLQPEGPYFLGGWCFGGLVAYEMAQQLRAQNQQIAILMLVDSYVPQLNIASPSLTAILRHKLHRHRSEVLGAGINKKLAYVLDRAKLKAGSATREAEAFMKRINYKFNLRRNSPLPLDLREQYVYDADLVAAKRYVAKAYPGRIIFFWASNTLVRDYEDHQVNWKGLATEGEEHYEFPGTHISIFREPHVRLLTRQLRLSINNAYINQTKDQAAISSTELE